MTIHSYILRGLLALGITVGINIFLNSLDTQGNQLAILPALILTAGTIGATLLGQRGGGGFSKGDLDFILAQRQREIDTFRQSLAASRERLSARIGALQDITFKRFGGQAEAQFGGRGLQVTGGAFQSTLARQAAGLQAQQEVATSQIERQDILAEQGLRASVFGQRLGGLTDIGARESAVGLQQQQTFGTLAGQLGTEALFEFGSALKQRRTRQPRSVVGPTSLVDTNIGEFDLTRFK